MPHNYHFLLCKKVHQKFSWACANIPLYQHVDQNSCHIRIPWEPLNGLLLYCMSRTWHVRGQSGWQGNARNNLSAIFQEIPSSSIIRHAAAHYVFIAKLYCCKLQAIYRTWWNSSAMATHTAAGRTPCFATHVYFIYFPPLSSLFLWSLLQDTCMHMHMCTVRTRLLPPTSSCQQFSSSLRGEFHSADANI